MSSKRERESRVKRGKKKKRKQPIGPPLQIKDSEKRESFAKTHGRTQRNKSRGGGGINISIAAWESKNAKTRIDLQKKKKKGGEIALLAGRRGPVNANKERGTKKNPVNLSLPSGKRGRKRGNFAWRGKHGRGEDVCQPRRKGQLGEHKLEPHGVALRQDK